MIIIISSVLFFSPALLAIGCGVAYSRKRRKAVVRKFAVDYREPMVFTLQFQQFSVARGQWLTDVLVVKDLKFWTVVRYIPRIIAWISPYNKRGVIQRVVWTQGTVIDDKPACPKCGATQFLDPQAGLYCSRRCWSSLKLVA